jgi:transcriptional regulator GlxA family with amidase domain
MSPAGHPFHVSLIATPDAQVSPLSGLFETLNAFGLLANFESGIPERPFEVDIVAEDREHVCGASGLPLGTHRSHQEISRTDIAIVPLMMVDGPDWVRGRYPGLVSWLRKMHGNGAVLCSACTGVLLLAETGLLDGREATIHWAFSPTFRRNFPHVKLRTEEVLLTTGQRGEFVMTGGVTSWHDLVLYIIARHVSPRAAQAMARLMMLQWHSEGQAPYVTFTPERNHGDATVLLIQDWLATHYMVDNPVEEMITRSRLGRRSFERRFSRATGLSPIAYVQALRIEEAKRRIESTDQPIDEISYEVGYDNAAFFRRLFKRSTRLAPGAYRRKFQIPRMAPVMAPNLVPPG